MHDLTVSPATLPRTLAAGSVRHLPPTFGLLLGRLLARLGAVLRRHAREAQRQRHARAVASALRDVDPRTLHDLGLHPAEITSVAAEMCGTADVTRIRVAQSTRLDR